MAKKEVKEKEKESEQSGDTSKSLLAGILSKNKDDVMNHIKTVTWQASTGSLLLDVATGMLRPGIFRAAGPFGTGKTPQTLECIRNILATVPNSKGLWVFAEAHGLSKENIERCGLKFVYTPEEWEVGTVFVLECKIFEVFIETVKTLVFNNPEGLVYAFGVDSVDGLILRDDSKKDITEANKVAGVPALSKKMLQSLALGMFKYGHWMGLISQQTAEIKLDPYTKAPDRGGNFAGGNALLHASDIILEYTRPYNGDFILDNEAGKFNDGKSKPIGQDVRVTVSKTMVEAARKTSFTYPIKYGRKPSGIWVEREIGDMMLLWGLASGANWITIAPTLIKELAEAGIEVPDKVQGKKNLYKLLEENTAMRDYLYKSFLEKLKK